MERKNITQPADWWVVFQEASDKAEMSLSAWIGEACKDKLDKKQVKNLSERPPANRPKKEQE